MIVTPMAHFVWLELLAIIVVVQQETVREQNVVEQNGKTENYVELVQPVAFARMSRPIGGQKR